MNTATTITNDIHTVAIQCGRFRVEFLPRATTDGSRCYVSTPQVEVDGQWCDIHTPQYLRRAGTVASLQILLRAVGIPTTDEELDVLRSMLRSMADKAILRHRRDIYHAETTPAQRAALLDIMAGKTANEPQIMALMHRGYLNKDGTPTDKARGLPDASVSY